MKRFIQTLLLVLTLAHSASAAIPTIESLFRNGANADVAGDTIAISFMIEKIKTEEVAPDNPSADTPVYAKIIFSNSENEPIKMLQILYGNASMDDSSAYDLVSSSNLLDQIKKDSPVERKLFMSMLMMYGLNSSEGMNFVIERVSPDFKPNREIVNTEKRELYRKYTNYLRKKGESSTDMADVDSPLKPSNPDEQEVANEILGRKFLNDTGAVELLRQKGSFFWEVRLENMLAKFTHKDHRLRSLLLTTIDGPLQVSIGDFVMFNGVHELPKMMNWVFPNGDSYKITTLTHQDFVSRSKSFAQRIQDYEKVVEKNRSASHSTVERSPLRQVYLY